MAKYYLVVEKGYEYNDEYYQAPNCGDDLYSIKSKLFKSKKEAQEVADKKMKNH